MDLDLDQSPAPFFTPSPPTHAKFVEAICTEKDYYLSKTFDRIKLLEAQKLFKSVLNFRNMNQSQDEANLWYIRFKTESSYPFSKLLDDIFRNKTFFTTNYISSDSAQADGVTSVYIITWKNEMKLKIIWDKI